MVLDYELEAILGYTKPHLKDKIFEVVSCAVFWEW